MEVNFKTSNYCQNTSIRKHRPKVNKLSVPSYSKHRIIARIRKNFIATILNVRTEQHKTLGATDDYYETCLGARRNS
jgi:hypothetical protein